VFGQVKAFFDLLWLAAKLVSWIRGQETKEEKQEAKEKVKELMWVSPDKR